MNPVLVDTGPLVALLSRRDRHHAWAREAVARVPPPLVTCEAVLSEACFLLRGSGGAPRVVELVRRGLVEVRSLAEEAAALERLLVRYTSVPMSFADACLVRLSELLSGSTVLTLDADFRVYRRNGRQVIAVRMPG